MTYILTRFFGGTVLQLNGIWLNFLERDGVFFRGYHQDKAITIWGAYLNK